MNQPTRPSAPWTDGIAAEVANPAPGWAAGLPRKPVSSVFLHGMWRSGSTYVWSRFREATGTCCYYEPLAPGLGRLTTARIPRDTPQLIAANRHPILQRPYFAEYAPLLGPPLPGLRGVKGFRNRFIFDRWALTPGEPDLALERYLRRLGAHAHSRGQVGVFGFNQTGLRIGWLRQALGGYNIQVERDPRDIWASYMEHRQRGNFTYFRNWLLILERNANHPLLAPLAARMPLRRGSQRLVKAKQFYGEVAMCLPSEELYLLVVYLWMACALHALSTCDLIIDTGLAGRRGYGLNLTARIAADTGLNADFHDLRSPAPAADYPMIPATRIEREAAALFPRGDVEHFIDPWALRVRRGEIARRKADLLDRAVCG